MLDKNGKVIEQRRQGADLWVKIIHWLGVCVWVLMIVVLMLTDKARPPMATFLDRVLQVELRTTWDLGLVRYACFLMIIILCLCTAGFFINSKRHQRKSDRYSRSLIVMGSLSALGIAISFFYLSQ